MGNKSLEQKVKNVLKDKEEEIIKFFNDHTFKYNINLALIKKYLPYQNKENIYLEIFNIPALFQEKNGFIFTINKISIYFFKFKIKCEQEKITNEEFNNKFEEFLKSILEANKDEMQKLLNENIDKDDLIKLKQGMDKLYQFFGPDAVKKYYKLIVGDVVAGALGGTMVGALYGFLSGFSLSAIGISSAVGLGGGLGIAILAGFVGYYIYDYIQKKKKEENIIKNAECLSSFIEKIKDYKVDDFIGFNLLVLGLNIDNKKVIEITMIRHNLDQINSSICPIIGPNAEPSSNAIYYYTYLDAVEYYIGKYSEKIKSDSNYEIEKSLKDDFVNLKNSSVSEIRLLIDKGRHKPYPNYSNEFTNTDSTRNQFPDAYWGRIKNSAVKQEETNQKNHRTDENNYLIP